MEQRHEIVLLAKSGEFTVTELCERFGISRKTAYKGIARYEEFGPGGLIDYIVWFRLWNGRCRIPLTIADPATPRRSTPSRCGGAAGREPSG